MYRSLGEHPKQTISTKLSLSIHTCQQTFTAQPLVILRLFFWSSVWSLSVAQLATAIPFFKLSLNFILANNNNNSAPHPSAAIEDARRQAIPVLVMVALLLTVFMPITILLPIFGILHVLSRMIVEIAWTLVLSLILLGAAAGLAPIASSLTLPSTLQSAYSTVIGLAFTIFILLFGYTSLLILLYVFHRGRGTSKLHTASLQAILYPSDSLSNETLLKYNLTADLEKSTTYTDLLAGPHTSLPQPPQAYQAGRTWTPSPLSELHIPTSGWDDDEDDKPANHARREKRRTRK